MTTTISPLHTQAQTPDLSTITAATRGFTETWQRGDLKFLPLLHEDLQRHARLLDSARNRLVKTALDLIASLSEQPLSDIISALDDDLGLLPLAQDEADQVLSQLTAQIEFTRREHDALMALPLNNGDDHKQRLLDQQARNEVERGALSSEVERLKGDEKMVQGAIATLEANGLQTRFGGVVPSVETLSALAAPGGEALVTAQVVGQAIKDLEQLFGDIVKGMQYGELHKRAEALRERIGVEEQGLRGLVRQDGELARDLAALNTLPQLLEQREQWLGGMRRLTQALGQLQQSLGQVQVKSKAEVVSLDSAFNQLLTFEQEVLAQAQR